MPDRSTHPTVVEYAVRSMMKGKSPSAAAKFTAKKLGGFENLFIGSGVVEIDPAKLEDALWDRLAEFTITAIPKVKAGFEHYAIDGAIAHFNQNPKVRKELKRIVIKTVGYDPFPNDDKE
jgi:hypothetical protein